MTPEIRAFEYAMGLFSVLVGLAVADIAMSFHRLMRSKQSVRWDPLTLMAAGYALCMAVYMWFDIWGVRNFAATRQFFFYLALVVELFVLFLVAAASLPDETGEAVDLRDYYARNQSYFWTLLTLFQAGYVVFGLYFSADEFAHLPRERMLLLFGLMCLPFVISFVLLLVKPRIVHYIGLGLLFAAMVLHYLPAQIN
jgi:hypothetical protein